ncbi:MAG TPA: serine/threonine-protein kinase [Gemmatimonadaceae bacterium]|jgi:serine/threonine protein kinase|nr:serine/threonine protein kinase [Gemmatimonadota bacterium]MBK7835316.1 serine/threonine protein kinase [Gemmatimonadota bacterium]MBK9406658.1 serine/threonine protein kinase [Gemmatimonadota bacterium]HNV76631.1 serine/threonine-protein kinase [Gemmatimonadaceae bacterium]HPV76573.1 serine/threonine-protein kinase [Gemmatimonadaceae bacterium]
MTAPRPDTLAFATALDGQYRLEREIGRGGMGIVYLARDLKLDRPVAIKTLPYHLASDPVIRERFLREARTAAALTHPSIVPIHRADELGDFVFFVMGYVDGESVAQRVRRAGPFAPAELLPLLIEVASALGYAHVRGVVHRDVKAENILLDATGSRAMVTDFGIARLAQSASLTQTGTVLGTVFYMSPEQVSGADVDGRSDLYSLGVLAFFALTGRFPFESETPSAVLVAHVTRQPPPIRSIAPTVPEPLAAIVDRLLLKDRALRYAEASEVVAALAAAAREIPLDAPAASHVVVSPTEAHAIWERAALLQEMTGQLTPPPVLASRGSHREPVSETSGYKVDEVRMAARDAGIGDKYVERALAERGVGSADTPDIVREGVSMQTKVNPLAGARTKLEFEAIVDGELNDLDLEDVAEEIRRSVGDVGNVNNIGRSVTWTSYASPTSQRKLQLSVSTRSGRTVIRGFEDLSQLSGGIFGGITGGAGGGLGGMTFGITMGVTKGAILIAGPAFAAVVAGAYGLARVIFVRVSHNREKMLRTAVERVAQRVRECIANRQLPRGSDPRLLRR